MYKDQKIKTPEDGLFIAGWIILAVILILLTIKQLMFSDYIIIEHMKPCNVYSLTGFYCPGCGGSRSVAALVQGKFLICVVNFPLVAYSVIMYLWFMISQAIERTSKGRIRIGLRWRHSYLWIALGILIAHLVIKNVFYLVTGVAPFLPV